MTGGESSHIRFSVIQSDLRWEDKPANLERFDQYISSVPSDTDLVVLPETFPTGFTMRSDVFAESTGETLDWMKAHARVGGFVLTGSMIARSDGRIFNRMFWVTPEGDVRTYDKRHLFRMGREHEHFTPGSERVIVGLKDTRFILQVCYDLRFPVFVRNQNDYDVIIYVANWPAPRHHVYEVLLRARAIENQAYVIAANRTGTDGMGVEHRGESCLVDPKGNVSAKLDDSEGILNGTIDMTALRKFRDGFPVHRDADPFSLDLS